MNAEKKIQKAKVQLILEQPFFATLVLKLQYIPDATIKTALTNGQCIYYKPDYIEQLTIDELKGVLAHEVMHIALLHHTRRIHRDVSKWNQAADYAVNPFLLDSKFVLPEGYLFNPAYARMSAEQIYNILPSTPGKSEHNADSSDQTKNRIDQSSSAHQRKDGIGDVIDAPKNKGLQETEAEIKQTLAQAAMIAKQQGKLPAHLERLVNEVLQPRIDWREKLARFLIEMTKNDLTWKKPSSRYLHAGLYLPCLENLETGSLILIVDTSSSINKTLVNQFAAEVQDIANTFKISLLVIYVDAKVQAVQEIEMDEPVQLHPKGGGGTDFRPGFIYIDENDLQPKAVLYLTDGICTRFPSEPDYPVLWAHFGSAANDVPFGETVQVI